MGFLQSGSAPGAQPVGQNPSDAPHIRGTSEQETLQVAGSPEGVRTLSLSLTQVASLLVQLLLGSQFSPVSTMPLPHLGTQSGSVLLLHPLGQQPSPPGLHIVS